MTNTLHELLTADEPDLPTAPRDRRGRHRKPSRLVRLTWHQLGWVMPVAVGLLVVAVIATAVLFAPRADAPSPACARTACGESAPYPTPVPGAPPQAPHAGWPSGTMTP